LSATTLSVLPAQISPDRGYGRSKRTGSTGFTVGSMIEPNGPLPQSVYWRRRAVAAAASVLAVVMLAWLIGGLVEADDQHPVHGTASASVIGGPTSGVRVTSTPGSAPPSSPGPDDPRGSVTAEPRADGSTSEAARPGTSPPVAPPTTSPPPGPPGPCADAVMQVVAAPDVPSYRVGTRPLLRLAVMNAGPEPCTRDVSRNLREILVLGLDGSRLWSSNDCYGPPEQDVRILAPNQPVAFTVHWAGRTSAPGCPLDRKTVQAGSYQVVGRLGALVSQPAALTMT
jgi:hypothetical protein